MFGLLRWRVRITIARYRRTKMLFLGPLLGTGLFLLASYGTQGMFSVLTRAAPSFADALLLGAFASVGFFQILAGFRWGVTRLFLNSDLEMLMCAPIPRRRLFGLKVMELVVASPVSIALLGAVTWGYARAHGMLAAPLVAVVLPFLLAAIAVLPGMLVALVLARAMIGPRLRSLIGVISPLLPLIWIFAFGSASDFYGRVSQRRFDAVGLDRLGRSILAKIGNSPTSWPGDIVRGIASGRWAIVGQDVLLLAALGAALLALTYVVFFATFEKSWTRLAEASSRPRRGTFIERVAPPVPLVQRAIVVKEWRTFTRDMRLLQSTVFPLLIFGVLTVNSLRKGAGSPIFTFAILIAFLLPNMAASALLGERRNVGLLKLMPVRGIDIILGKVIAYLLPIGLLIGTAAIAIGLINHTSLPLIALTVLFATWLLTGSMLGGVGIGALWGSFDNERPRLGLGPTCAEMAILAAFAATQGAFGYWLSGRLGHGLSTFASTIVGFVLFVFAAGTAAVIVIIVRSGGRRLERIDV